MSDPDNREGLPTDSPAETDAELDSLEGRKMAGLLRQAMGHAVPDEPKPLLSAVQRKIRQRSRGKFYGDGWSTSDARVSYILIAVIMLLVLGVAYFALGPVEIAAPK
jgi:hypothetical protein